MSVGMKAYLPPVGVEDITPELIKAFHSHKGLVWMRDDYLSMRAYAQDNPALYKLLEKVAEVKEEARRTGMTFEC
jgi:hypothetical protein